MVAHHCHLVNIGISRSGMFHNPLVWAVRAFICLPGVSSPPTGSNSSKDSKRDQDQILWGYESPRYVLPQICNRPCGKYRGTRMGLVYMLLQLIGGNKALTTFGKQYQDDNNTCRTIPWGSKHLHKGQIGPLPGSLSMWWCCLLQANLKTGLSPTSCPLDCSGTSYWKSHAISLAKV